MNQLPAPPIPDWIVAQLPATTRRYALAVGEERMHVMEVGAPAGAARPVLLLHGNPTWGFLYRRIAALLADEPLRLIMPDLIGLGFSSKPARAEVHQLEAHGAWLGACLDQLALQDVLFVGQDWGGPIGLRALADRPEMLAGLVLLNTTVGPPRAGFRPTLFHRFSRMPLISDIAFRLFGFPQRVMSRVQHDRGSIRGDVARAYRYPLRRLADNIAPLALARMVPDGPDHPSVAALARCQVLIEAFDGPAALVWGTKDPILGRVVNHVARLLPQAEVTRLDAGHFIQEEAPEQIAAAIRAVAAA